MAVGKRPGFLGRERELDTIKAGKSAAAAVE
jgi:hypothetical protein